MTPYSHESSCFCHWTISSNSACVWGAWGTWGQVAVKSQGLRCALLKGSTYNVRGIGHGTFRIATSAPSYYISSANYFHSFRPPSDYMDVSTKLVPFVLTLLTYLIRELMVSCSHFFGIFWCDSKRACSEVPLNNLFKNLTFFIYSQSSLIRTRIIRISVNSDQLSLAFASY